MNACVTSKDPSSGTFDDNQSGSLIITTFMKGFTSITMF